jgi:arylsulfatase A
LGRYAFRTGVLDNNSGGAARPQREISIARVLHQAGYATAVAGKWRQLSHLTTREDGQRWGWDEFLIWGVGGNEGQGINRYWDPVYIKNGQSLEGTKGKYGPDLLHEFVVDFIRRHRDRPFFVYYPMPLIHGPILPTPDTPKGEQPPGKKNRPLYAANIAYLDKLTGKLVAELDALGLRQKTLLVFTGDNGSVGVGTINGRPITGAKGSLLEGGSRVPLIASWPGTVPAGKVLKDLVDFSDFFPTFAEAAGAKLPQGVTIDGRSFAPQLRGQPGKPRDWIFVQLGRQWYVRSQGWKLTESGGLFDMQEAPFVEKPVPADTQDESARSARKRLQTVLDQLSPASGKVPREAKKPGKAGKKPRTGGAIQPGFV